ncbi:hypothetical protein OESDEN_04827 [Oesophagostomum dentatum]|uniref:Uncharacterized protein n=1 Tax=Oesophagostomum dentatum TaxID=61180 RepID=A0A0B1TIK7_OESDE|nr:hypothetical protein OESDEN_04827 [Oesophagostomum dentatum]
MKKMASSFGDHRHQVKRSRDRLQQNIAESDQLCQSVMSRIMELSNEAAIRMNEKLTAQIGELSATSEKLLEMFVTIDKEASNLSNVFKELKKDSQFMVDQRRKLMDEDRAKRANAINALRKQEERISKMSELAQAILAECDQHKTENKDILDSMELHDQDVLEEHAAQIGTWESALQGWDDMATEALGPINETSTGAAELTQKNTSSVTCALREACSNSSEVDEQLKHEAKEYMLRAKSVNASTHDDMTVIQDTTDRICEDLENVNDEIEQLRLSSQKEEVKREQCMVQNVRDRLGVINKDVADMVDVHWIHPQTSGKTPARSHRQITEDEKIPSVPKKDAILQSNGYITVVC